MSRALLTFNHKEIRSRVIAAYMKRAGYKRAVCFSCGNAANELTKAGVEVLHIGEKGLLTPNKWFTQAEIAKYFDGYFDATSGHLPPELMNLLAIAYRERLEGKLQAVEYVPTGSGETLVCLKLAFPANKFVAVYNIDKATEYSDKAPLNRLVGFMADGVLFAGEGDTFSRREV